jgi:hypothetical protein
MGSPSDLLLLRRREHELIQLFNYGDDFQLRSSDGPSRREGEGGVVGSHVLRVLSARLRDSGRDGVVQKQ